VIETDVYVKFETNLKEKFGHVNTPLHIDRCLDDQVCTEFEEQILS
jgi:argininosuccinate lyase